MSAKGAHTLANDMESPLISDATFLLPSHGVSHFPFTNAFDLNRNSAQGDDAMNEELNLAMSRTKELYEANI